MGYFTIYDPIIGNPGIINGGMEYFSKDIKNSKQKYNWNHKVRVVLKNGKVTNIGSYNFYGDVILKNNKKYNVCIMNLNSPDSNGRVFDGFLINNITYKYLLKNPLFKKISKKINLFEMIMNILRNEQQNYCLDKDNFFNVLEYSEDNKFYLNNKEIKKKINKSSQKKMNKHKCLFLYKLDDLKHISFIEEQQDIKILPNNIEYKNYDGFRGIFKDIDNQGYGEAWMLVNPEIPIGKNNHNRIIKIVDLFLKYNAKLANI
jgi:hypothetical protein